jgi:hypothetical protein
VEIKKLDEQQLNSLMKRWLAAGHEAIDKSFRPGG